MQPKKKLKHSLCAVTSCANRENHGKPFFKFPTDISRCREWVRRAANPDFVHIPIWKLHQLRKICRDHFDSSCFVREESKRLIKDAIPTIFSKDHTFLSDDIMCQFPPEEDNLVHKETTETMLNENPIPSTSAKTRQEGFEESMGIEQPATEDDDVDKTSWCVDIEGTKLPEKELDNLDGDDNEGVSSGEKELDSSTTDLNACQSSAKSKIKHPLCSVKGCSSRENRGKTFFRFPTDISRRREWIRRTGNPDLDHIPIRKLHQLRKICRDHFDSSCFFAEGSNRLTKDAIPTIFSKDHTFLSDDFIYQHPPKEGNSVHKESTETILNENPIPSTSAKTRQEEFEKSLLIEQPTTADDDVDETNWGMDIEETKLLHGLVNSNCDNDGDNNEGVSSRVIYFVFVET